MSGSRFDVDDNVGSMSRDFVALEEGGEIQKGFPLIEDPGTEWKGEGPRRRGSKRYRGNWSDSGARPGVDKVGPGRPGLFRVLGYMPAQKHVLRSMHDDHFSLRRSTRVCGLVAYFVLQACGGPCRESNQDVGS